MSWYLYLALKQLFPTGKKVSFFAIIATVGATLGVMILIVVMSIFNGFGYQTQKMLTQWGGDITIWSKEGTLYDAEAIIEKIGQNKFVIGAAPFLEGPVMLQYKNNQAFPGVKGIDVPREIKVVNIKDSIIEGSIDDLDDESVIVSSGLFKTLGLKLGDQVDVYTPLMMQRLKEEEIVLPRELKVVGELQAKWNQIDANTLIVALRTMQDLYGSKNGVQGITIKIDSSIKVQEATALLRKQLPESLKIINWTETSGPFLFVLKLQKTMMFFIILFVVLVASFSITSSLMGAVVRKTKEIGLLCALGANTKSIAAVFCLQGLVIGVIGTILGIAGAILGIYYRNDIVHFLMKVIGRETLLSQFYQFSDLPAKYESGDFVFVIGFSVLIATCAGLLPAIYAARLKPADALRSE